MWHRRMDVWWIWMLWMCSGFVRDMSGWDSPFTMMSWKNDGRHWNLLQDSWEQKYREMDWNYCRFSSQQWNGQWISIDFSSIHHLSKEWPMERRGGYQGYQWTSFCSPCPVGMQIFHWSFPTRRWSSSKIVYIRSAIGACAFTCCASTSDCWTKRCRSKWSCWWLDFNEKFPSWLQMLCAPVAPHAF